MKTDVKEKWVEDLLSGDFEQGVGALRTDEGYCCLGVLCETMMNMGYPISTKRLSGVEYKPGTVGYHADVEEAEDVFETSMPSGEMYEMAGLLDNGAVRTDVRLDEAFFEEFPDRLTEELDRLGNYGLVEPIVDTLDSLNDRGFTFREIAWLIARQM